MGLAIDYARHAEDLPAGTFGIRIRQWRERQDSSQPAWRIRKARA
jgi:hypothetical protein